MAKRRGIIWRIIQLIKRNLWARDRDNLDHAAPDIRRIKRNLWARNRDGHAAPDAERIQRNLKRRAAQSSPYAELKKP